MDCSMPGFPVHNQLPELGQTHVHWVGDVIQPSYPLSSPSHPAFNLSQHQGLLQWVDSASGGPSIGASALASVLPMNIQNWFPLRLTGLVSLQSKGLSRVFSNTTVQKHQFFSAQLSLWSNPNIHDYWENYGFDESLYCLHCFPIYLPWNDGTRCHDLSFFNVEFQASFFTLLFHFHQEVLQLLFTFCHKGGVICIWGVIWGC